MSYRVPAVGETWRSRVMPSVVTVDILDVADTTVSFRSTTVIGTKSKVAERTVELALFVHHYELSPEASSAAADTSSEGVADGATLHLVGDLPFDPPPSDMFGVPL